MGPGREYGGILRIQEELHAARKKNQIPDTLILVEHLPVYTLGRSGSREYLRWSAEMLRSMGIEVFETKRGGDVTYHGPGQLVGYPIIHLEQRKIRLLQYIEGLEEVLIRVAAKCGVKCGRDARNHGVWVGNDKVGALGIHVSRWVTMHGFALNVNTNLDHYQGIVPCGLRGVGVTSLARQRGREIEMSFVKQAVSTVFREVFGYG